VEEFLVIPHGFIQLTSAGGQTFYLHHSAIIKIDPPSAVTKYTTIATTLGEKHTVQQDAETLLTIIEALKNCEARRV
jgi:hypothetical protein